jgi:regulator of Ty1 transposition protein 109
MMDEYVETSLWAERSGTSSLVRSAAWSHVDLCVDTMPKPSLPVSTLCAHLLSSLVSLPGSRTFHLHVLVSTPRKPGQSLFLYASPRPKCLVQDVLVLLSEQTTTHVEGDSSSVASSNPDPSANLIPRIFVSAIEASVYAFPASNSTILYVSKVDGTGQGAYPSPTSTLLRAFLAFYASPRSSLYTSPTNTHHVWIHLFARSQRQYLFPNSADHPDKKPLGDIALCRWWKKTLSDVAKDVETKNDVVDANASPAVGECFTPLLLQSAKRCDGMNFCPL